MGTYQCPTNINELKKAQQDLQYHATFDEMTGLTNRCTGVMLRRRDMARVKRTDQPPTVCYADLDNLKAVNDQYGHQEGDWMIPAQPRTRSEVITQDGLMTQNL